MGFDFSEAMIVFPDGRVWHVLPYQVQVEFPPHGYVHVTLEAALLDEKQYRAHTGKAPRLPPARAMLGEAE